jgi:hypothetical protein
MAEVFFILIIIYAAYVIHTVINGSKEKPSVAVDSSPAVSVPEKVVKTEQKKTVVKKKPVVKKSVPVKSPTVAKKTASVKPKTKAKPKVTAKPKSSLPSGSIRHPDSGEIVKVASQYRMTKRWIKEALVEEGLLDKVYKTNELDDKVKAEIDKAMDKLVGLKKYQ